MPKKYTAQYIPWSSLNWDYIQTSPDPDVYDYRVIAEGDSWFTLGGMPQAGNLLFNLRFPRPAAIVNCARPGDTIVNMARMAANGAFEQALQPDPRFDWSLLLLSGGGNDLIDHAGEIIRQNPGADTAGLAAPQDYLDAARLEAVVADILLGYRTLAAMRADPALPVVAHTYDYATPRNSPALFFGADLLGPWLYPALTAAGVPENVWPAIGKHFIDTLGDALVALEASGDIPGFHVADTRGTLTPAKTHDLTATTHWLNEIHPNSEGYKKLAREVMRVVEGVI